MKDTLRKIFGGSQSNDDFPDDVADDYVEIDANVERDSKSKVLVRPFVITDFADIKPALDSLRDGYTISLLNIKPLKEKDIIELKRAVNKLKKTCEAINGDIAGFGEDWIVITPNFAQVYRSQQITEVEED